MPEISLKVCNNIIVTPVPKISLDDLWWHKKYA